MDILIVEDHGPTRERLELLFGDDQRGWRVVAAVASAEEGLEQLAAACPDVVILDLGLPGMSGEEAIPRILDLCPETEIMIFTVADDDEKVFSTLKAGASGYILKDARPDEIVAALEELRQGGAPMSFSIARKVLHEFRNVPPSPPAANKPELEPLSSREEEVLRLLYSGATYKEIAAELNVSVHTVHTHIKHIYRKLHANSRSLAIYEAIRRRILRP